MKRFFLFGLVLGAAACAPKAENPEIIGVTFDRLFEEGWQAYARGDYATAEAKFDSILKYVDATRPEIYLALSLAQVPLSKFSNVQANARIALSLIGEPFDVRETLLVADTLQDQAGPELEARLILSDPFIPVGAQVFQEGMWWLNLRLLDATDRTLADGLAQGQVPLGFVGETVAFLMRGWNGETLYVAFPDPVGGVISTYPYVDSTTVVGFTVETLYYVPGETLVVDTVYEFQTVSIDRVVDFPRPSDGISGLVLVRNGLSPVTDLHILAYHVLGLASFLQGGDDPLKRVLALSYFQAALQLAEEKGGYSFEPVPGLVDWGRYFSECYLRVGAAEAAISAFLYYNAVADLNAVLVSAGETPLSPFFTATLEDLVDLYQGLDKARQVCGL